jgi:hypothetical protein
LREPTAKVISSRSSHVTSTVGVLDKLGDVDKLGTDDGKDNKVGTGAPVGLAAAGILLGEADG